MRSEIDAGLELVRTLDQAKFGVRAALWLYSGETESWRFIIAVGGGPEAVSKSYLAAAGILSRWKEDNAQSLPILDLARVKFVGMQDMLIKGLSPIIKIPSLGEVRFSNNVVNGIYVEDALIHRLAA